MKSLIATLPLLCVSCVTAEDLRKVSVEVNNLEDVLNDKSKTLDEQADAIGVAHEAIEDIAADVTERTKGWVEGISNNAEGGLVGIAAAVALNMIRNRTRKRDLEAATAASETG